MTESRLRRWWLCATPASLCAALVALAVGSTGAGARPVAAHPAACGGGSGTSSVGLTGGGSRLISELDVPVCATGQLTITFAGDPAAGCVAEGLCDYSGTETFAPSAENVGGLDIITTERHGRRSTSADLLIGGPGSPVTSAVQRTSGGSTSACSDSSASLEDLAGVFLTLPVSGGRARVDLTHTSTPMFGSRCAGPLDADVASAMPSRSVPLHVLERGDATIDLTGGGQFTSHGMSGTVSSTLVLRLGHPQREQRTTSVPSGPSRVRVFHSATVAYRVVRLTGDAVATVQTTASLAACGPFDACDLGGTITVSPGASARGSAFFTAENARVTVGVLRAELRGAGPSHALLEGGGSADVHGTVQAALTQDGNACSDAVALHQFTLHLARRGSRLEVSVSPSESQAADPLRTRCPGPDLGSATFAAARLPAGVLARPEFTARLHGEAFSDGPYRVTTQSTLAVTLRRGATNVHVIRVRTVGIGPSWLVDRFSRGG